MDDKTMIEALRELTQIMGAISDGLYALCEILEQNQGGCKCGK